MHSRVFQWNDMKASSSEISTVRNAFDSPTLTLDRYSCHITTLNPGKEPHPSHQHPEEELLVIKEGTLEVMQNGVTNRVGAGGMVFCASNELHGWRNTSPAPVTYYVIKVYPHDLNTATNANQNATKR
jgi:quercetin dioxygenase-like cupin family protein